MLQKNEAKLRLKENDSHTYFQAWKLLFHLLSIVVEKTLREQAQFEHVPP